ncbi:hypothetical protein N1030_12985 [Desulfovibrio mangrovi]|uniref:hypothetical protein n=1 Tax=Desulfovibrio mangrovi TaxID=2976983 RepID=UPI002246CF1D|nr:hypothetical protein [Desulfovibrio mangrovi]UZP66517.1 hypothetical protein N1030_12985 [Desulfovibrio mangrovi]
MKAPSPLPVGTLVYLASHFAVFLFLRLRYGDYRKVYALSRFRANCEPAGEVFVSCKGRSQVAIILITALVLWGTESDLQLKGWLNTDDIGIMIFLFLYTVMLLSLGAFIASDGVHIVMRRGLLSREHRVLCQAVIRTELMIKEIPYCSTTVNVPVWNIYTAKKEPYVVYLRHDDALAELIGAPIERVTKRKE